MRPVRSPRPSFTLCHHTITSDNIKKDQGTLRETTSEKTAHRFRRNLFIFRRRENNPRVLAKNLFDDFCLANNAGPFPTMHHHQRWTEEMYPRFVPRKKLRFKKSVW
jgi:hypothetical protein